MARYTSADEVKAKLNPSQEVLLLREQVKGLNSSLKTQKILTGQAMAETAQAIEALSAFDMPEMQYKPGKTSGGKPLTYVVQITDTHMGEVTVKDEVEGFGEFNPELFHVELERLASAVLKYITVQRAGYNIPTLQILYTGDYISGGIHPELLATNAFPEPVQAIRAAEEFAAFMTLLAPHFDRVNADWITNDNHGRLTRKNQAAQGGQNNWGYVVAHGAEHLTRKLSNVRNQIWAQPSHLLKLPGANYLMFHGHQLKGWAGIPYYGFERRVGEEAKTRLNMQDAQFDKLVFGHFHVSVNLPNVNTGGSLSGTNAFDHSCGRRMPAHQTGWMLSPTHGEFDWTRWWLTNQRP